MRKLILILTLSFLSSQLLSQNTKLTKLFKEFDSYNYKAVIKLLDSIDEKKIIIKTPIDSINFSLYKLIKLKYTDNNLLKSNEDLKVQYGKELNYLISKKLENYLTYFLNHYSEIYKFDFDDYATSLKFINLSIEIAKKDLNMSHFLSVVNLFDAYETKFYLFFLHDSSNQAQAIKKLINHYEKNQNKFSYLSKEKLYKKYFIASSQSELKKDFRFLAFEKAFSFLSMIDITPKFYEVRDLLFSLRNLSIKTSNYGLLKRINKGNKYKITKTDSIINACYYNELNVNSFKVLENYVNNKLDSNFKLSVNEIFDLKLLISRFSIKTTTQILEDNKKKIEFDLWQEVYKLSYKFNKLYGTSKNKLSSINAILYLKSSYSSKKDENNEIFDAFSLKKEKQILLYDLLKGEKSSRMSPNDFIDLFKLRSLFIHYPNWSLKEIEIDIYDLFNTYKKTASYKDIVKTLDLYWQHVSSVKDYKVEGYEIKGQLLISKKFINNELNSLATDQDLNLRISISNLNELENLKVRIQELFDQLLIDDFRFKQLNMSILKSKYNLNNNKSSAFDYYKYLINNIDEKGFESSIIEAMGLAVDFKFNYNIVKLSNSLMRSYNKFFINQPDLTKLSFQMMAGYYYKYIRRTNKALMFFIEARANTSHWNFVSPDYSSMTRENSLTYEIFNIYISKKNIKKGTYYLKLYQEAYERLLTGIELESNGIKLDPDMFIEIKRKSLDMKRRLLFVEKKHKESESVINLMLALENKKSYYGKFNLSILKLRSQVSQNKFSNKQNIAKLDSIYLLNNKPFDNQYYTLKNYLGETEPEFISFQIKNFKSQLSKINLINQLSYENQLSMMINIGIRLFNLEKQVLNNSYNKDELRNLFKFKLSIDDLDRYNTQLLNLSEQETNIYFELLNKRYYEKDYDKLKLVINEFDIFQQEKKINFSKKPNLDLVNFQLRLTDKQAYIRFSKLKSNLFYAYIVSKNNLEVIKMPDIEYEKIADFYTSRITKKVIDTYTYNTLFKPIFSLLPENVTELFIKNDGIFNNINIEALWIPESESYIFDHYQINYIERPSAIFNVNKPITISSAFLFGNPDFAIGIDYSDKETSIVRSGINPLPYTAKEVSELNSILANNNIKTVTTDLSSSTEQSLYDNSKSSIIHIATHGFYNDGKKTDRFNWGLLASGSKNTIREDFKKERRNDGIIFGGEILLKNFTQTELVVLSACETGYGTSTFFGSENLANSFLRAGAKNIVSTLWPVDDKITQKFMSLFYIELLKNKNINLALRRAKEIIKKQYINPIYWAPFVLVQNKI